MPLFRISELQVSPVPQANFLTEKALQVLVERNLGPIFNCRFVASEFSTGAQHGGRIDTLALSDDNNPVIVEYKKVGSSELVNQSLYYLAWLNDHRADFTVAAQKALGAKVEIDWSDIRVVCIAPNYRKYDLYAMQVMGWNIELWTYRRFADDTFFLEESYPAGSSEPASDGGVAPLSRRGRVVGGHAAGACPARCVGRFARMRGLRRSSRPWRCRRRRPRFRARAARPSADPARRTPAPCPP
jgi:hypothetical protein